MESENYQENNFIVCERCKIKMDKTELKNVYECPACHVVEERKQKK